MSYLKEMEVYTTEKEKLCNKNNNIDKNLFKEYGVNAGLRDINGNGVLTGLTNISEVSAFEMIDGVKTPANGKLFYRGYNVKDLIKENHNNKYIFEEAAYLLLFGELPTKDELKEFQQHLTTCMSLPSNFTRDVIMKASSSDVMNSMTKSVLSLSSYDKKAADLDVPNVIRQCIQMIAVFPMLAVYGYHAYNHYENDESMYIHRPDKELSMAENFLRMLRPDKKYTELEALALNILLVLHMEHGGGNNSTFTTRVVTSAGSDTYSTTAAALCSLKGSRHGGANIKVMKMIENIKENVRDITDENEVETYLSKMLDKEVFDKSGLIYGMGHAVYSLSDPREEVLKSFVTKLAEAKHFEKDLRLYEIIEENAPKLIAEKRKIYKGVSPNVDFYSGFVYEMLSIPHELFTPLFAIARIVGWSAHRIEEIISANKIIRPAYKTLAKRREYISLENR